MYLWQSLVCRNRAGGGFYNRKMGSGNENFKKKVGGGGGEAGQAKISKDNIKNIVPQMQ